MIYCVIPQEMVPELYDKLSAYYADDPHVEVIVDRRSGPDRRARGSTGGGQRQIRDRRRQRVPSTFPTV